MSCQSLTIYVRNAPPSLRGAREVAEVITVLIHQRTLKLISVGCKQTRDDRIEFTEYRMRPSRQGGTLTTIPAAILMSLSAHCGQQRFGVTR